MREILFRGKRVDNGEWVQGDLLQNVDCLKIREQEKDIKHIAKSFVVIPETVGQYTGLTDKNGTKIFEGDIVKTKKGKPYEIKVYKGCWAVWNGNFKNDYERWDFLNTFNSRVEIIGNITDNPELLGGD